MSRSILSLQAAIAAAVLAAAAVQAGEMSLTSVPKPVLQTVKSRFKSAMMVGASQDKTPEGTVYEVSLRERGMGIDVSLDSQGKMLLFEKQIARKDLPKAVADTLNARYPRAKYRLFEQAYQVQGEKETLTYYEAVFVDPSKKIWAVELGLDGTVRKVDDKTAEEEEQ
jgi:hypothetical protein